MRDLESKEIVRVTDNLIGLTTPVGETNIDEKRFKNLKKLIDLTDWCLDGLYESAVYRHRLAFSERTNGETAYAVMVELRDWLSEKIDELA